MRATSFHRALTLAWPWVLALVIMAPLLRAGYVLTYDMVFVPDQGWRNQYLGLGGGLPRAVPSDALVVWFTAIVPAWLLQKAILVGVVGLGGWGILRIIDAERTVARLAAVSCFVWNPYVAERLLIGQWVVLIGYAVLPWVLVFALAVRSASWRAVGALIVTMAVGATSASGGVMAAMLGLAVAWWWGSRAAASQRIAVGVGALAVNLPWIVSGLLHRADTGAGADAVRAFAASGEGHLGVLFSVVGLGGIWNAQTVPDSRLGWVPVVWTALLLVVVVLGLRPLVALLGRRVVSALAAVAAASLALGLAGVLNAGLLASLADQLPGFALFRDGTRYLSGLAVLEALAFGLGAERVARRAACDGTTWVVGVALALAPIAAMPDLAWGVGGRLSPVDYPASWTAARAAMVEHGGDGQVLVLPASPYRAYPWNDHRPGLDPAPRFFPNDMLSSDALRVDGVEVQAETPGVEAAYDALSTGDADRLRDLGVGFVIVDAELEEYRAPVESLGAAVVFDAADIVVYALADPDPVEVPRGDKVAVVVAWSAAGVTLCGAVGLILAGSDEDVSGGSDGSGGANADGVSLAKA